MTIYCSQCCFSTDSARAFCACFSFPDCPTLHRCRARQRWAARNDIAARVAEGFGALPVPATAAVLLIVVAAVVPQLGAATQAALSVLPGEARAIAAESALNKFNWQRHEKRA